MTDVAAIAETKRSPLDEEQRMLGATMGERNGWSVALSYGDVSDEYAAVRDRGAGMIDLSSRARFIVSGSEAVPFLNGLITNDVKTLEEGRWMPAAFPTVQGRLLAAVRIIHRTDGFLFDTETATRESVLKTLERFTLAGDFHVAELTDQLATVSIQGARAKEIVQKVLGNAAAQVKRGQVIEAEFAGHSVSVIRATHTAEDGFDLFTNATDAPALWNLLRDAGAVPVGLDALEILRIEAGVPLYGVDVDATNVVLEAGLDDAVSFTKGCYIGQEIIARIHWRGHVAKKICGFVLNDGAALIREDKLRSPDGKEIGRVTSTAYSPRLSRGIALCMIKYDYLKHGTEAIVVSLDGEHSGSVSVLPLICGSWYDTTKPGSDTDK